ncbi:MAG: PEP-CTERM sorting domain-containing protein [Proteobacteria bacterium]|nr:PEP-CTERM sorting domain-containing protein [Pseudomonadota bacterium]
MNHADFITADTVEIKSGGATIDTTDKEVWVTKGMVGAGSLTKTGSGILKLDGANTFAGNTAVNQGTLTVNGSLAGGVSVASGSLLKGSGTIGGASTVNGTLAAGNSPGQMTFSSDLSLGSGSNIVWELFGNTSSDATQFDRISVGGNLLATSGAGITLDFGNLAGGSTVDWSDSFWSSAQSWTFLMVAGSTTGFDNLSLLNSTFLDAAGNSLATARSGSSFSLSQSGNSIMVSYAAVPEPGTGSLLLMGLASLTLLRMRRSARI